MFFLWKVNYYYLKLIMCTLVFTDALVGQKLCYGSGGAYMNGQHVYPRQAIVGGNTLMPMYPLYQYHHPTETIGVPAHHNFYQTAPWVPMTIMSKPSSIVPHTGASHGSISFSFYCTAIT